MERRGGEGIVLYFVHVGFNHYPLYVREIEKVLLLFLSAMTGIYLSLLFAYKYRFVFLLFNIPSLPNVFETIIDLQ